MHHLIPQFILEKEKIGQTAGQFDAPALFIDVSGFSAITDVLMQHGHHGSEVLARVMRAVFTPLVHNVYAYGGFITTFAGDAFTAVFPQDSPQHALTAAWQMIQHMQRNDTQVTEYGSFSFSVRIGLAVGDVQWGILHSQDQEQAAFYFKGSAIQGCIAAEGQAQSGQLVLHDSIYQALPNADTVMVAVGFHRVVDVPFPWPETMPIVQSDVDLRMATRFFPQALLQQVQSGEFRHGVCAFINLQGDPSHDELDEVMRLYFSLQKTYGGLLSRIDFGDKGCHLLMFWGAPKSYEQDLLHALGFMLDFRRHARMPLRVGLTYQIAHAGFVGSALHEEYTLYGRGINLAARLMVAAPWQEIWIDEHVVSRLTGLFQFNYLDELPFKGFVAPQPVYQLVRKLSEESAFYQRRMVGRERELTELKVCAVDVLNGRFAGLVNIIGEPGIGKSRLIYEFLENTAVLDHCQIFLCQTDEIVRRPFNPFRYFMFTYFNQSVEQDETKNKAQFELALGILKEGLAEIEGGSDLIAELDRTTSFLGALIDLYWPESLYEGLEPQLRFENSIAALKTLFKAESLLQPILIILEDVHWLDDASYTFVEQLTLNIDDYPIFIIATSRPEETSKPLAISSGETTTIHLHALESEMLAAIAYDLLGGNIAPALANYLVMRADGNPFFAEQMVLDLQERDLLVRQAEGWSLLEDQADSLPMDVRAVLLARLDRLTQEVKDVVHTASVLGREFELRHLLEMLRDDHLLPDKVAHAEEKAIWSVLREMRYIFKHALLRDAAYRMQLRARRHELHGLVVEVLELLYAEDLRPYYAELAHHAQQANQPIKAREYYYLAGELTQRNGQNNLSVSYFTQALELTSTEDIATQINILFAREEAYYRLGQRELQWRDLDTLEELTVTSPDQKEQGTVKLRRCRYANATSDYELLRLVADEIISIATQQQEDDLLANAYIFLAHAYYWQGEYAVAQTYGDQSLAICLQTNNQSLEEQSRYQLGQIAMRLSKYENAENNYKESLRIAHELGDQRRKAIIVNNLGLLFSHQNDYDSARGYFDDALALYKQIGSMEGISAVLNNLGLIFHVLGAYEFALTHYEQAKSVSQEIGDKRAEAIALNNIGEILLKRGDAAQGKIYLEQALAIEQDLGIRFFEAHTISILGKLFLSLGQYEDAERAFQSTLDLRRELKQAHLTLLPLMGLAQTFWGDGREQEASDLFEQIMARLADTNLDGLEDPFDFYWACYTLMVAKGDGRSPEFLQRIYTLLLEQAKKIPDLGNRESFLENVTEHRQIIQAYNAIIS